ncbi:MAG: hypothetical protein WAU28_05340 [Candidatus Moraniibacteriota bacterium]
MKPFIVGGIEMQYPIILGAGALRHPDELKQLMRPDIPLGAAGFGSVGLEASTGNPGNNLFWPPDYDKFMSVGAGHNSFGMPGAGAQAVLDALPYKSIIPIVPSLTAKTPEMFLQLVRMFHKHPGISALDFNTACPNLDQPPIGFNLRAMETFCDGLRTMKLEKPGWMKIPRYITKGELHELSVQHPELDFSSTPVVTEEFIIGVIDLIARYTDVIRAVIGGNSLGGVIRRHTDGKPVTDPNDGRSGLTGPIIKQSTLCLVDKLVKRLPSEVDTIASGGMINGDDACDCFERGVKAVSFTSVPFWLGDPARFFANLLPESERFQNYLMQHSQ